MLINAVPQWLGAVGPRAEELPAGCVALAEWVGRVLGEPIVRVPQSGVRSPVVDGIANRDALVGADRAAQLAALEAPGGPVLTIGGDCGVELVPVSVARFRYGPDLTLAWFDAHADLNTARSSPSGAFHGMVLRSLFGDGDAAFAANPALERGRGVLIGTRVFDKAERDAVDAGLVTHVPVPAEPARLRAALGGDGPVYLHVDLDVLDPAEFAGLNCPEPGGLTVERLAEGIRALAGTGVIGAGITECVGTGSSFEVLEPVIAAIGDVLTAA